MHLTSAYPMKTGTVDKKKKNSWILTRKMRFNLRRDEYEQKREQKPLILGKELEINAAFDKIIISSFKDKMQSFSHIVK